MRRLPSKPNYWKITGGRLDGQIISTGSYFLPTDFNNETTIEMRLVNQNGEKVKGYSVGLTNNTARVPLNGRVALLSDGFIIRGGNVEYPETTSGAIFTLISYTIYRGETPTGIGAGIKCRSYSNDSTLNEYFPVTHIE